MISIHYENGIDTIGSRVLTGDGEKIQAVRNDLDNKWYAAWQYTTFLCVKMGIYERKMKNEKRKNGSESGTDL